MEEEEKIKEELKDLPPEDKIKKLREIKELEKKKLEEAEKLILEEQKEMERQERVKRELERIVLPEQKKVDIKKLFTEEEDLEETVKKEKIEQTQEEIQAMRQYEVRLSKGPVEDIYNKVRGLQNEVEEKGYMSDAHRQELNALGYAMDYKQKDIDEGKYKSTTEEIEDVMGNAKSIIKYLRG